MPKIVDRARIRRCEDEDKNDNHQTCTPNLALHRRSHQIETIPVDNYVPDDNPDNPVECSRCSCFHWTWIEQHTKDIASNAWNQVDDQSFDYTISILYSGKKHEGSDNIAENVHEMYVHENSWQKSIKLRPVEKLVSLVVSTVVDQSLSLYLQQIVRTSIQTYWC